MGERIVFLTNSAETTRYPHTTELSWTPYLKPYTKTVKTAQFKNRQKIQIDISSRYTNG